MALRLPRQPLLGFLVQAIASCLWKPYPSVTDVATYLVRPHPTPVANPVPGTRGDTRCGMYHARKSEGLCMTGVAREGVCFQACINFACMHDAAQALAPSFPVWCPEQMRSCMHAAVPCSEMIRKIAEGHTSA